MEPCSHTQTPSQREAMPFIFTQDTPEWMTYISRFSILRHPRDAFMSFLSLGAFGEEHYFLLSLLMPFLVWMSSTNSTYSTFAEACKKSRAVCVTNWLLFRDKSLSPWKWRNFLKHSKNTFLVNLMTMWKRSQLAALTRLCGKNGNKKCTKVVFVSFSSENFSLKARGGENNVNKAL